MGRRLLGAFNSADNPVVWALLRPGEVGVLSATL